LSDPQRRPEGGREPRQVTWIWLVYLFLFNLAIPWYWPAGFRGPLVAGLPTWVAVTIAAVVLLAIWTGFVIHYFWDDDFDPRFVDDRPDEGGAL
jgi:hypothetical protein